MRRLLIAIAVLAGTLAPTTHVEAASPKACDFPAHHTVQSGESLWSIARDFLNLQHGDCDYRGVTTDRAVSNEVTQIKKLNHDELDGQHGQVAPGQRLLLAPSYWDVPDGKPGWGTGFTYCTNERPPSHNRAPYDGFSLSVHLADPPLTSGHHEKVVLVVTNHTDRDREFSVQLGRGLLLDDAGHAVGSVIYSDAIGVTTLTVEAHSRAKLAAQVRAKTCGDTRFLDRRVPPGHYDLYGVFHWGTQQRSHDWASAANTIRVVRR